MDECVLANISPISSRYRGCNAIGFPSKENERNSCRFCKLNMSFNELIKLWLKSKYCKLVKTSKPFVVEILLWRNDSDCKFNVNDGDCSFLREDNGKYINSDSHELKRLNARSIEVIKED